MAEAPSQAVFLSYASQDAAAVRRIAEALRTAGVEVWFDQNELVGGDAWDAKIRGQIARCALFVPVISAATQARGEGYFRLEWKLAVDRSHLMAHDQPFLLPVVINDTSDAAARVPPEFRAVQWTRLPGGEMPEKFCARVQTLLSGEGRDASPRRPLPETDPRHGRSGATSLPPKSARRLWPLVAIVGAAAALVVLAWWQPWRETVRTPPPLVSAPSVAQPPSDLSAGSSAKASATAEGSAKADKSVVVLPLENLSPDPENAFFTDGIHAEITTTLSRLSDLKVISRDSALALKGSSASLAEKAHKVGVANVLTGSVRRAGTSVRVSLELRRARDEALLWSQTYNKELGAGVLAIQTDIAEQVARVLQARHLKGTFAGARFLTNNAEAYDRLMKLRKAYNEDSWSVAGTEATFKELEHILRLDPNFMPAADFLSSNHSRAYAGNTDPAVRARHAAEAKRWAEIASRLMPGGAGDGALAHYYYRVERDSVRALEYANNLIQALPNEATGHNWAGLALGILGRRTETVIAIKRAIELDPLNSAYWSNLLHNFSRLRRGPEAKEALVRLKTLTPNANVLRIAPPCFALWGELPDDPGMDPIWLRRTRRFSDLLAAAERGLTQSGLTEIEELRWLDAKSDALHWLGRREEALVAARTQLALAERRRSVDKEEALQIEHFRMLALAYLGRAEDAIAAGRRIVESISANERISDRFTAESDLAALYAFLHRPRECVELLAKLLRVPSGLTVPMLKVDPAWDNVREDAAFKTLLADPKNSAPL